MSCSLNGINTVCLGAGILSRWVHFDAVFLSNVCKATNSNPRALNYIDINPYLTVEKCLDGDRRGKKAVHAFVLQ